MSFDGFPDEAFRFCEGLCADNTKAYWPDHRPVYDSSVKAPRESAVSPYRGRR